MSEADILARICATTREETARRKAVMSLAALEARAGLQTPPRGFAAALDGATISGFGLIAEIKRASPSKGLIRTDFDPASHARAYAAGGAACLSVLTDAPFFQGSDDFVGIAREACALPVLRKDFMLDPWQVVESRSIGADAILIIMAAVDDALAAELHAAASQYHLDVLVEVHDAAELERAAKLGARLIGINSRNLRDFSVDFSRTLDLARAAPANSRIVAESGISSHLDIELLAEHGIRAFLVGESLMRQHDLVHATRALLDG